MAQLDTGHIAIALEFFSEYWTAISLSPNLARHWAYVLDAAGNGTPVDKATYEFVMDLLSRMRRNPAGDWTIDDVGTVCYRFGLQCQAPSGGGSHYKVSHPSVPEILTIPARKPIKVPYIRKFVRMVDLVRGER
jgi:hypothetical protein